MYKITAYRTSDGQLHGDVHAARNHAVARHADALCKLAHALVAATGGKYGATCEFIDDNAQRFAAVAALKADISVESEED